MKTVLCLVVLYCLLVVVMAQWGSEKQKREQLARLHHEPEGYGGPLDYEQAGPKQRRRRTFVAPGMDEWNNPPPGANEKNRRIQATENVHDTEEEKTVRRDPYSRDSNPRKPPIKGTMGVPYRDEL